MTVKEEIKKYIAGQTKQKQSDLEALQKNILKIMPGCKLWFLDGKNGEGKIVSNPNIGYGSYTIKYADGKTREFYQVGLSANTTGISVYVMGIDDNKYLAQAYGKKWVRPVFQVIALSFKY